MFSLMPEDLIRDPEGLCSARFHADFLTRDVDYASLAKGDTVTVDGRTLVIVGVGKRCHAECPLVQAGRACKLKTNCAFAEPIGAQTAGKNTNA